MRVPAFILLFALSWTVPSGAPPGTDPDRPPLLHAFLRLDRGELTVGDPVAAVLTIHHSARVRIDPVTIGRRLGSFSVGEIAEPDTGVTEKGDVAVRLRFPLTVFRPGPQTVPSLRVTGLDTASGRRLAVATVPVELEVRSVLQGPDPEPADIRNPVPLARGRGGWIGVPILLAVAALTAWWWRRRAGRLTVSTAPVAPRPEIPAHQWALHRLRELTASDLLRRGEIKPFFVELAEIHKEYLQRRFGILTLERTTDELVHSLRTTPAPESAVQGSRELLAGCDLVKFARFRPSPGGIRSTVDLAYRLIEATRAPDPAPGPASGPGTMGSVPAAGADR